MNYSGKSNKLLSIRPKITIIVRFLAEEMPVSLSNYLEYVKNSFAYIYTGDKDLRIPKGIIDENNNLENNYVQQAFLGKGWLIQKYNYIIRDLEFSINILQTPEEIYNEKKNIFKEKTGIEINKENEVIEVLKGTKILLHKYVHFIKSLKFDSYLLEVEEVDN